MKHIVVTIDGGACSGKSSVARKLAENLGFRYINTGILYRFFVYELKKRGVDFTSASQEMMDSIKEIERELEFSGAEILYRGTAFDQKQVASEEHGILTSKYALDKGLRDVLTEIIRKTAANHSSVVDGRDGGSFVFPEADYKFYIDIAVEKRVRNWAASQTRTVTEEEIQEGIGRIRERDARDKNRDYAPLCIPKDAKVVHIDDEDIPTVCHLLKKQILAGESNVYMKKTSKQVKSKRKSLKRIMTWHHLRRRNNIRIENEEKNTLKLGKGEMRQSSITIYGVGNYVEIKDGYDIVNLKLLVRGNNNKIIIGEEFVVNYNTNAGAVNISVKDDNNEIIIGDYAHIRGEAELVCMEGTSLTIGYNFGMSSETIIRTGDGHRIFDKDTGERTNPAQSIVIGNDCWVARRGIILKGVVLKDYTILGTGALVTKSFQESNIVLGGNPAKIIKHNVTWLPGRR